jgi:hypothetical protein
MPFLKLLSKPESRLAEPDDSLVGVTVFTLDTSVGSRAVRSRVDPEQRDALMRASAALAGAGVTVKVLPADLANKLVSGNDAFGWWVACMDLEKPSAFAEIITEGLGGAPSWLSNQWIPLLEFTTAAMGISKTHSLPAAGAHVLPLNCALGGCTSPTVYNTQFLMHPRHVSRSGSGGDGKWFSLRLVQAGESERDGRGVYCSPPPQQSWRTLTTTVARCVGQAIVHSADGQ